MADPSCDSLTAALERELDTLRRAGLYRTLRRVEGRHGVEIMVDGRPAVDFSSNDYLGLASDPRVAAAVAAALGGGGAAGTTSAPGPTAGAGATGAAASRSISGNHPLHEALEAELAALKHTEAALLFPTGFAANTGAIPALAGRGDVIYTDELNHASIIDGCRLSRGITRSFPHADLDTLARMLDEDRGKFRRRLIVVEGVYSMDGDLFPLDRLAPLAREHGAAIYLDDAHGTGVLGASGAGSAEHWDVARNVDVVMGTLGKALGVSGAFVAGSRTLREYLVNRARPFIFSTATPPALAAGVLAALRIVREEPWRRERLRANIARLRAGLGALGRAVSPSVYGHIVPIVIGESDRTAEIGRWLVERGFLVGAVRPPSVPLGKARLRITLSAAHTEAQIDALISALEHVLAS